MKVTVYDGAQTIGGSKVHVEEGENGLFLDFGMNFAKYSLYYEEFMSERPARGLHDLWRLNLIPRINNYRADLIPRGLSGEVSSSPKIPINAVVLSHAHLDHAGNVALLSADVPLVTSPVTAVVLKALRDTSSSGHLGMGIPYYLPKKPKVENPEILEANRGIPYTWRPLILTEPITDDVQHLLTHRVEENITKRAKKIEQGEISTLSEKDLGFEVRAFPVDHSIPGACAYIIEGDTITAYTGDFRLHGKRGKDTRRFIRKAKSASVLITEGTRVSRDEDENVSEREVYENALATVEESNSLVVADFSPRNFERLETFLRIADRTGRSLVVTPKDIYSLMTLSIVGEFNRIEDLRVYSTPKASVRGWEKWVLNEFEGQLVTVNEVSKNPGSYILCFSFYDLPHLLDVNPRGGTYIYSSSEAFSEEQVFSFLRLWNWLRYFKFDVYGFGVDEHGKPVFEKGFHASGHIPWEELREVIDEVDPDYIIPVHTESPEWFKRRWNDKTILLRDGESRRV